MSFNLLLTSTTSRASHDSDRRTSRTLMLAIGAMTAGCASYQAQPLDVDALTAQINQRAQEPLHGVDPDLIRRSVGERTFDPSDGWSLFELQVVALLQNPELKADRDELGVAAGELIAAGKLPNPVITDSVFLLPLGAGAGTFAMNVAEPILTAGKRRIRKEKSSAELERVEARVEAREWDTVRDVADRYWTLRFLDERIRVERDVGALADRSLELARARLDAGDTTPFDSELAASVAASQRARVAALEGERAAAVHGLARRLGLPSNVEFRWERDVPLSSASDALPTSGDLEALALTQRRDLREARKRYDVAEKAVELAYAGQYPDVDVGPGIEKSGGESARAGVFFGLPLPFFNRNEGEIRVREAERDRVAHEMEILLVQTKQEISTARARIDGLGRAARLAQGEVLPKLEQAFTRAQSTYDAGQIGAVELLSVQERLARARLELLDLLAQWRQARLDLERAIGSELAEEGVQ